MKTPIQQIIFHASPEEGSFLNMLRPYRGLKEEIFLDLRTALQQMEPEFKAAKKADKDLMSAIWTLCFSAKYWGTEPDSMLVRNELITDADRQTLRTWINELSLMMATFLQG
ncbi:MAG: hypothetical protein AAFR61_32115 [Bacteroidota bacterium]